MTAASTPFTLRAARPDESLAVAEVVCASVRDWYAAHGKPGRFPGGAESALIFPQVYEALDPGCCVVAEDNANGRLAGACFYHPRELHVSLGILSVHPDYFCRGVAKALVRFVCDVADRQRKPLRLVSSAMNLDSFSVYTRHGFVPRAVYHTMNWSIPDGGTGLAHPLLGRVRDARPEDAVRMAELEFEVSGIRRLKDYEYFIANSNGAWHVSILDGDAGQMEGFLASGRHEMLGPGVMRSEDAGAALILAEVEAFHRGGSPTFLVPAASPGLVRQMYQWGAKNSEVHLCQVRGEFPGFNGVSMPTFMPETG
jgi:GNAT superfamily N-acetyltransferase